MVLMYFNPFYEHGYCCPRTEIHDASSVSILVFLSKKRADGIIYAMLPCQDQSQVIDAHEKVQKKFTKNWLQALPS